MKKSFWLSTLLFLLWGYGILVGYKIRPDAPLMSVTISAPAAPDPSLVFPLPQYLEGMSEGIKLGEKAGRREEYLLLKPIFNKALKEAYRPVANRSFGLNNSVTTGFYTTSPVYVEGTYIEPQTGVRLRVDTHDYDGLTTTDIYAFRISEGDQ